MSVVGQHMQQARRDAGRGDGVHALDRDPDTPTTASPAAWTRTRSCRASRSSSTSRSASSRRSRSSAPAGASGRGWRASASARRIRGSWRFKFHGQTSGVDLTRQQPLNNVARVTVQAMAGIFGGLQSLHTDCLRRGARRCRPRTAARIAVATQNILREEAHLTDVIDPLGGSLLRRDADRPDGSRRSSRVMRNDRRRRRHVHARSRSGLVQAMIGDVGAGASRQRIERGEQTMVGVNAIRPTRMRAAAKPTERPDLARDERAHRAVQGVQGGASPGATSSARSTRWRAPPTARRSTSSSRSSTRPRPASRTARSAAACGANSASGSRLVIV